MKALLLNDFQRWCSEFLDQFSDLIIEQPLNNPVTISEIILTFFNGWIERTSQNVWRSQRNLEFEKNWEAKGIPNNFDQITENVTRFQTIFDETWKMF